MTRTPDPTPRHSAQLTHGIGLLGLAMCLAGCVTGAVAVNAAAKATTIRYITWYAGQSTKPAIALFEKEHPDIHVDYSVAGSDYVAKLTTMASAGVMPDVVEMETWMVYNYGDPGLMEDLAPYLRRDKVDTDDFLGQYLKAFTYNSKLQAVPIYINCGGMDYNVAMFERAGVAAPDQTGKTHWDWTDLLAAAKKLTKDTNGDGKADVYGWGEMPSWVYKYWLCQNGGRFFSLDMKRVMVGEPEATQAFQFEADMSFVHAAATFGGEGIFGSQQVAMYQGASWMFPNLRHAKTLRFDVAPWFYQKKPYTELVANGLGLSRGSKNKEAAWTFIKWMASKEGQKALVAVPGFMPARLSVARSDAFLGTKPPEHMQVVVDMALKADADDFGNVLPTRVMDSFWPEYNKLMAGKTTAIEAMKRATPAMQKALDEFNKRRLSRAAGK